jgi:diguanylate cyclase (GGDEF)-like protein
MKSWRLWAKPRRVIGYVLAVELLTVGMSVAASFAQQVTWPDVIRFAMIVVLGLLTSETARHVERMRRHLAVTLHVNLSSVWMVPAALLLPPSLVAPAVVVLYGHMWLRIWRHISGRYPHRVVFSASTVVLSCFATRAVAAAAPTGGVLEMGGALGLGWLLLAIIAHFAVNTGLVAFAIALEQNDHSPATLLGTWHDNSIEFATLSMGGLTAVLLTWKPALVVLILLPLQVLHRSVLIRQLEHAATIDEKTGLLNATSWQTLASNELHRAERHGSRLGLLLVDLDHFKWVNDRYGHLVGDQVLRAVADAMRDVARDFDLCGRFGGEEFVVLLPETDLAGAIEVANRMCARIRELPLEQLTAEPAVNEFRLSASIGVAAYPDAGRELDEVLLAADNAMFAAKDSGRDQVRAVMPSRAPERKTPTERAS